jgi:hypothetical protein
LHRGPVYLAFPGLQRPRWRSAENSLFDRASATQELKAEEPEILRVVNCDRFFRLLTKAEAVAGIVVTVPGSTDSGGWELGSKASKGWLPRCAP